MSYTAEQLLEHATLGVGKVLLIEGDRLTIHFKKDGVARKLSAKHAPLKPAAVQQDPYFDGVRVPVAGKSKTGAGRARAKKPKAAGKYPTQQAAVEGFLKIFPLGFNDPAYLADDSSGERSSKLKAHELWNETLNKTEFERLLEGGEHDEVVARAKQVESSAVLLHPQFERAALWKAVGDGMAAPAFSQSLFDLIYGTEGLESRFNQFVAMLDHLPQSKSSVAKWPAATIFPFLALPKQYLFMKPEATKKAAQRLGFSLNYKTSPNWLTFSSLLELGSLLKKELAELEPRDMIDVQSFIYVTGQENYPGS